nr:BREX protein BrxB domain-containing protein [Thiocapsa sp.]
MAQEYRDAYFESPDDLAGYQTGELSEFIADLIARLKIRIEAESGPETVVALLGVGTLFGLARVSTLVEGIKESVTGRLLVFFPGEHHPEHHSYRLLDARDGWNYLAVPLQA